MKIKWGALVVDGRNKIGGHVASKNRSGAYLRTKVTPVNPQTASQSAVRASFGVFSQAWSGLSASLINAWNGAVSDWQTTDIFGDLKKPTGKNLFLRLNQQATQAGFSSFTAVPSKAEMVDGIITAATLDLTNDELNFTGLDTTAGYRTMIFATQVLSQGTSFVKNKLRLIGSQANDGYASDEVYNYYVDKFGVPVAGENVYFGIKYVYSNGQSSPLQIIKGVVSGT